MTAPFDFPSAPHVRRRGPLGYAGYESYRPWLRDEFTFRCVYCLTREAWTRITGTFAIDHFLPVVAHPTREVDYDNLLYACIPCNLSKGSSELPDPLAVLIAGGASVSPDGVMHASAPEATRLIEVLGLNRDRAVEFRELWIGIVRLAGQFDPDLYRAVMGYPTDLPDLSTLEPPGGNDRPDGVKTSHFEQKKAGTLPETY